MKKSTLIMVLSLVLSLVLAAGGTLAYLTDEDGDINVMTVGNVQIVQNEQQRVDQGKANSALEEFEQNKNMMPIVNKGMEKIDQDVNGWGVSMRDEDTYRNYVDKIVSVTNKGNSDAYVRTIYAFPEAGDFNTTYNAAEQWFHWNGVSDTDTNPANGWIWGKDKTTEWPANTNNWDVYENVEIEVDGEKKIYDVYVVTNKNVLAAHETTAPSLLGMFLDARVDCEVNADGTLNYTFVGADDKEYNLGDISKLEVLALSQAVQADGFDTAWEAFEAAFPTNVENLQKWLGDIEVGSPGDKNDTNNPPVFADVEVSTSEQLMAAIKNAPAGEEYVIDLNAGNYTTNINIGEGKNVVIRGSGDDTVISGQIAATSSTPGGITLKNLTVKVDNSIQDTTGISQTGKSAIALWGTQTAVCENVTFDMSLNDGTAITSWWDTGIGTSIVVKNCTFNCNGQRPIRATGNVTVENTTFNDPYRYAVQLTAKASTATELDKAIINFKNNTIVNGPSGKNFVYGIQMEGADYGCNNCVINGAGNTIVDGGADSTMYYCECGKVDHDTITWNTEVSAVHEQ